MEKVEGKSFWVIISMITAAGMGLRFMGFPFEGVDYQECLATWSEQLNAVGNIRALSAYSGDYNYPYVTILYFLTLIPIPPLYSIKLVSVLFDFLEAGILTAAVLQASREEECRKIKGAVTYALVFCNPLAIMNSSYLAQCESIWTALGLLAFYLIIVKERPGWGMFAFGMALSFKLQAVFILPILLIFYFYKKKFSIFNLLWIPVAMEVLCIPAIIGGCGWDCAFSQYMHQLGEYPYMFYYYPNVWTYFQAAPYYVFGKIAIVFTFVILVLFAVLFVKSGKQYNIQSYICYAAWTAMTCTMFLPCMHERYNYMAEILLPVGAVSDRKLRIPAFALLMISAQCIGQQFLDWFKLPYGVLAAGNIALYFYLSFYCLRELYEEYHVNEGIAKC